MPRRIRNCEGLLETEQGSSKVAERQRWICKALIGLWHQQMHQSYGIGAPVDLIPGCAPQIVVATLYINGAVPFSALAANVVAPRAASLATVWSLIPALIVGYALHIFAQGLMN